MQQWSIIFDEIVPLVRCQAKADGCICLVLCNLHAQEWGSVHAAERLERAIAVHNRNAHGFADGPCFRFSSCNEALSRLYGDARLLESIFCHGTLSPFLVNY